MRERGYINIHIIFEGCSITKFQKYCPNQKAYPKWATNKLLLELGVQQKLVLRTLVHMFKMSNVAVTSDKVSNTISISHSSSHSFVHNFLNINCTEHHSLVINTHASHLSGIGF